MLPDEDFATALHHFTGSKAHHIRLRGHAQDRGLTISEWGVHRGDEKLAIPNEEALYARSGCDYVPPELREDAGEFEAAQEHRLPHDLLDERDIRGVVHSHTTWSDGRNTLEEMATAAKALGLEYLTVTDHSQAAAYAGGLDLDRLRPQWDEIDALNEKLAPFRLLKGIEVDILEDGALDLPDAALDELDVVIGSVHVRHGLDEAQMTARVLRAFDHPRLQILGHPTGRLIQEREPYGLRMDAILEKAAATGVAIEVNGNPDRLDLKAEHVRRRWRAAYSWWHPPTRTPSTTCATCASPSEPRARAGRRDGWCSMRSRRTRSSGRCVKPGVILQYRFTSDSECAKKVAVRRARRASPKGGIPMSFTGSRTSVLLDLRWQPFRGRVVRDPLASGGGGHRHPPDVPRADRAVPLAELARRRSVRRRTRR